jgi:ABC-type antimicrobial peptide transport system permease subunit
MSEGSFAIKDLVRRKFQTSMVLISLTLSVASTLFLLLFSSELSISISSVVEGVSSVGFTVVFSRFILFIGILVFIVGAVITSFMTYLMMSERIKDIGMIKAAGCSNERILYYFRTELLIVTFLGCFLGIIFGIVSNFVLINFFSISGVQLQKVSINLWFVFFVFLAFFSIGIIFGGKPISDANKVEPAKAISPTYYYGLNKGPSFSAVSKSRFTMRIALRNLYRHKSTTIRIISCLTVVFILVTVAIAGGVIADQTSKNWVTEAVGSNEVMIANQEVCNQYELLLSKFYATNQSSEFNYTQENYLIPEDLLTQLNQSISGISIDPRLITEANVTEVPGIIYDQNTGNDTYVGSNREGVSLVVGLEPGKVPNDWFTDGEFLQAGQQWEAVIGDSIAQEMFTEPLNERLTTFGDNFGIVGVCIDPINNGKVIYVPLNDLQDAALVPPIDNATNRLGINMVLVKIGPSVNYKETLDQIRALVDKTSPQFGVLELNGLLDKSLGFLDKLWSTIMFLPAFSLVAASICLVGYVMLSINEQHQELGILRAIGAGPKTIIRIISEQSFIVLLSCYALGIIGGISLTWLILVPQPLITSFALVEITGWLLIVLAITFVFALYPAIKFSKRSILEMMA